MMMIGSALCTKVITKKHALWTLLINKRTFCQVASQHGLGSASFRDY